MKKFLNILLVFLIGAAISSCCLFRKVPQKQTTDMVLAGSMKIVYERDFNPYQFDSLCVADTIPQLLTKWRKSNIYDYETQKSIDEYLYIKRLGTNESIYRLILKDEETYNVRKRIVYETK